MNELSRLYTQHLHAQCQIGNNYAAPHIKPIYGRAALQPRAVAACVASKHYSRSVEQVQHGRQALARVGVIGEPVVALQNRAGNFAAASQPSLHGPTAQQLRHFARLTVGCVRSTKGLCSCTLSHRKACSCAHIQHSGWCSEF